MATSELKRIVRSRIHPESAGLRLVEYLANRFTYHSRDEWLALIAAGRLRLNEAPAQPDQLLVSGDSIEYFPEEIHEPDVNTQFHEVYADEYLLVIDKPGNLPCHPAGRYFAHTLWALLGERYGLETCHFISRLDRETSGLLLVARTPEVAAACRKLAERGRLLKIYGVLVEGHFPGGQLAARGWLVPDRDSPVRKKRRFVPETDGTEPGVDWERCGSIIQTVAVTDRFSLLSVRLETGRTHQIRATLQGLGFPVVGDKVYGVDETLFPRFLAGELSTADWQRLRLGRQALHAWAIEFPHPVSGTSLRFAAPLPAEILALLPADAVPEYPPVPGIGNKTVRELFPQEL